MRAVLPIRTPLLLTMLGVFGCVPVWAQPPSPDGARNRPVDSVLARLERDTRARAITSRAVDVAHDILDLRNVPTARRDSLVAGLERLALLSSDKNVAHEAASLIGFAGYVNRSSPAPGIVRRLAHIYRTLPDPAVQLSVLNNMPEQSERQAALAFLRAVAVEPNTNPRAGTGPHGFFGYGERRIWALERLTDMGEEGRAVLQAMHRTGEARSPQAQAILAEMARRGFPVRDIRRPRPQR